MKEENILQFSKVPLYAMPKMKMIMMISTSIIMMKKFPIMNKRIYIIKLRGIVQKIKILLKQKELKNNLDMEDIIIILIKNRRNRNPLSSWILQ